jgi:hypothetical protein
MGRILESRATRLSELGRNQPDDRREDADERREEATADEQDRVLEGIDSPVDSGEAILYAATEVADPIVEVVEA